MSEGRDFDVIIVGGGPAGLTAGLYCARAKLNVVLYEKLMPGGEILNTEWVEDYPGFELIGGPELAKKFEDHARKFGLRIELEECKEVYKEGGDVVVVTDMGVRRCGALIYCAGGHPRKLGIPGEEEFAGKGVSYCALCDGAFFQDEVITVVGGGNAAVEEGHFLTRYGSKLYLVHRRDKFRAQPILVDRLRASPKAELILGSVVEEALGDGEGLKRVRIRNVKTGERWELETGGLFIFIGFVPNTHVFRDPIEKDGGGFLITDENMQTSIPGIFTAGDCRSQLIRQITNAVGDATTAAVAAQKYLEAQEEARKAEARAAR